MGKHARAARTVGAWLVATALVASCATPYGRSGFTGGYSDQRISDSAYVVSFNGNGYASQMHVWNMWIYRCAELTLEKGFRYFTLKQGAPQAFLGRPQAAPAAYRPGAARAMPAVYSPGRNGQAQARAYKTYYYTITTWNSSATVLMYKAPLPEEIVWAFDAMMITHQLEDFVRSGGRKPAPGRDEILGRAYVAHSQVLVGDPAVALVATPETGKDGKPLPTRPAARVKNTLEGQRPLLAAVFREHQKRETTGGTVVVGLTVTPNGGVVEPRLVNSTIADKEFNDLLLEAVRRTEFGPADVASTTAEVSLSFESVEPSTEPPAGWITPGAGTKKSGPKKK